ncbi:hypothetical protein QVD17_17572 [Tagetes erecta]|uniref:Uncharacterized protein n=1 Tax=Tagetes erecta TaxID=13708 RepID=A0AAD8P1K7_TARER|nr:hypothetical protein QVD17_17572 [Tagetes erecta]
MVCNGKNSKKFGDDSDNDDDDSAARRRKKLKDISKLKARALRFDYLEARPMGLMTDKETGSMLGPVTSGKNVVTSKMIINI